MNKFCLNTPVELKVAADPGMMLVIRLTTAGVVTRAGLTIDAMDNLKIATEEACNCLIGQENPPKQLGLTYVCRDDSLFITVCGLDMDCASCEADEAELDVIRCILESLADEVSVDLCDGRIRAIELRAALI
ncbi:MAG: hypothetical protein Q4A66_13275 [Eubacteriales bacterium]|nr:hypothetical protein [Eubacteriales bacterium]